MQTKALILTLCLAVLTPPALAADDARSADAALAMRFCEMAQQFALPDPAHMRQCATFLEAARLSDLTDPRYPRLLADVLLGLDDTDGALAALEAIRKLRPADQTAQLDVIFLYAKRMQSVDQKLNYLKDLLERDSIPAVVRSVLASQCAQLLLESGKEDQAREMTERALTLNPLNLASLSLKAQWLKDAPPAQRAALLVAMLRSNPEQPDAFLSAARIAGSAGLTKEAIDWYRSACWLRSSPDILLEEASELFLDDQLFSANEQKPGAAQILDGVIAADPQNYQAIALRVLVEKRNEKKDAQLIDKLQAQARNCLVNRLAALRQGLGVTDATTRPVTDAPIALPDLAADIQRWNKSDNAQLKDEYLRALAGLAFFEVYVNNHPDEAEKLLGYYTQMSKETDPVAARIAGWILLARDRKDEARVKLSAAASANDALATLGLIRTFSSSPEDRTKATETARRLLAANPAGPLAAVIYDAVRDLGVKVTPSPDAPAVKAALDAFPGDFMNIMARPQRFYSLRAEPLKVSHSFGQPLLVRFTLQNNSEYDLTIGSEGIIKPDLWIDAQLQGANRGIIPGACIERLTDVLVLKPRQSITRVVRVDQNDLSLQLRQNPALAIILSITLRTNVISPGVCGACGQAASSTRLIERSGFAQTESAIQKLCASLTTGSGDEKIRNIQLLAMLSFSAVLDKDSSFKAAAPAMTEAMHKALTDPSPAVRAYVSYQHLFASAPADQTADVERMLADSAWQVRLLGLAAITTFPPDHPLPVDRRKAILADAAKKMPELLARSFAAASLDVLANPPATQPATRPK
ncbi:MAG: hypothetical protein NTU53_19435 [Planctomycetota bacterium]|nr:hypothetical protein [Planctomycetota bacterium]